MAYQKKIWKDLPNEETPITADELNRIEQGVSDNDQAITNLQDKMVYYEVIGEINDETGEVTLNSQS